MRRILHVLCTVMLAISAHGWSQTLSLAPPQEGVSGIPDSTPEFLETKAVPIRLPSVWALPEPPEDDADEIAAWSVRPYDYQFPDQAKNLAELNPIAQSIAPPDQLFLKHNRASVKNAFADSTPAENPVRRIPSFLDSSGPANRIVRYEVPLNDEKLNQAFMEYGIEGQLIEVVDQSDRRDESISDRLRTFLRPNSMYQASKKVRVVRYEVPADDIRFHAQFADLDGQILEPGMLRMPEVRFFQPKARVFMDLKRRNDGEFDLFSDGAILASLDVIELYFPMPLISERFAEVFGRPGRLASLGWRVGGTLGMGITTALNNGTAENGSAPVSTLSTGIRYEFPLGRPSPELLERGDSRLDQRTRVGMEFGMQGGISTLESLTDSSDLGLYFGILVNTPWGG